MYFVGGHFKLRRESKEVNHNIKDTTKAAGALMSLRKRRHMSKDAKVGMSEGIVDSTLRKEWEAWGLCSGALTSRGSRKELFVMYM